MSDHWYALPVNPDPWAIGPLSVGRKNGSFYPYIGRNDQLAAYKETVASLLERVPMMPPGEYKLTFYFWRRLDSGMGRTKHAADATNLQKATEDALQGVVIDNDRNVRDIRGVIAEQGPEVTPVVLMHIEMFDFLDPMEIPNEVWDMVAACRRLQTDLPGGTNEWPPRG